MTQVDWPTFDRAIDAVCFNCQEEPLAGVHRAEEYEQANGGYMGYCSACDMVTYFNLKEPIDTH